MHHPARFSAVLAVLLCFATLASDAEARRRRKRSYKPPPTHPIFLWAKTVTESQDLEQRKVAAFKLSHYTQPIFQEPVINALLKCMKDPDLHIKVLCTKALGRAKSMSKSAEIRKALVNSFQEEPFLRSTITRVFIARKEDDPDVHSLLLDATKKTTKPEDLVVLLGYFEQFGNGTKHLVDTMVEIYQSNKNDKVRTAVVKALADTASGQEPVIALLTECVGADDTPLVLTCLSALQLQAQKDVRAWRAVERTITSSDPDVLEATLDVIDSLPETPQPAIARNLLNIINEVEDAGIREKAVLGLGICGDAGEDIVEVLKKLLEESSVNENIRIAAALVLGKQAFRFPDDPLRLLAACNKQETSQSLRTACQLGTQELQARKAKPPQMPGLAEPAKPQLPTPPADGPSISAPPEGQTVHRTKQEQR